MRFDPRTDRFPYPEYTDQHYLKVKKNNGLIFDENYPYFDESKMFKFKQFLLRIVVVLIVFPLEIIYMGLRIKGRKNLKKHKEVLKKGVISTSNHIHLWDYLNILKGIRPFKPHVLVWAPNIRGENGPAMRLLGGIPIPENDLKATNVYMNQVVEYVKKGGWLHIYSEGSMWEYYGQIRPFKKGTAYFAIKADCPILPMAHSYRKAGWIRRKIFKQIACLTLHIGEPIFINKDLPKSEQEADLTKRVHEAVCKLAEIDPKENLYPPIFEHNKRIDYYTTIYGVNYKG